MRFSDPRPRRPRRSLPIVEGLETRELMSTTPSAQRRSSRPHSRSGQLAADPDIRESALRAQLGRRR